jgi:hypothetical protein
LRTGAPPGREGDSFILYSKRALNRKVKKRMVLLRVNEELSCLEVLDAHSGIFHQDQNRGSD